MFLKFSKSSQENLSAGVKHSGTGDFLWILQNFQEHLFCRTSLNACVKSRMFGARWNETMKNYFHFNLLCPLKNSRIYEGLKFYLKGTQSQIISCKMCEVLQIFSFTSNTTYYRETASEFEQHFWHIACFIRICHFSHN